MLEFVKIVLLTVVFTFCFQMLIFFKGNHKTRGDKKISAAKRRVGLGTLDPSPKSSRVFTSGYVNTETILYFLSIVLYCKTKPDITIVSILFLVPLT